MQFKRIITLMSVIALIGIAFNTPSVAQRKLGVWNDLGRFFARDDGLVSKDELINMISEGQVLCHDPRTDGACSLTEIYTSIGNTFSIIESHLIAN